MFINRVDVRNNRTTLKEFTAFVENNPTTKIAVRKACDFSMSLKGAPYIACSLDLRPRIHEYIKSAAAQQIRFHDTVRSGYDLKVRHYSNKFITLPYWDCIDCIKIHPGNIALLLSGNSTIDFQRSFFSMDLIRRSEIDYIYSENNLTFLVAEDIYYFDVNSLSYILHDPSNPDYIDWSEL